MKQNSSPYIETQRFTLKGNIMKIYVVMQTVDLGGHPQVAFCNESVSKSRY